MKEPGRVRIAFFCLMLTASLRAESSAQVDPEVLRQQGLSRFRAVTSMKQQSCSGKLSRSIPRIQSYAMSLV